MMLIVAKTALVLAMALAPGQGDHKTTTVAGTWTMNIKSPHGPVTMTLALQQDGKKVTGTLTTPHGDMRVDGDVAEHTLKLATPRDGDMRMTLTAKMKGDGTLDGYLSSEMGDMTWTAERVKDK
jgi:hypothetical protein